MTYRTKALSQAEIEEHLARADELGVSLKEYALAYNVNLNTRTNAKATRKKPDNSAIKSTCPASTGGLRLKPCTSSRAYLEATIRLTQGATNLSALGLLTSI